MAFPVQPTHNHQDDFSPGTSKDLHETGTQAAGNFGMLQRKHTSGPVLPDRQEPSGGTSKNGSGGGSD